ncbi:MAG: hypothetical protein H0X30_19450 [Anaerolineae bacterium]|nr:hypothetical protein [Anaerolineae bacterium]
MAETITLELSPIVLERAQDAANRLGTPVEIVLADWLEHLVLDDVPMLLSGVQYALHSPIGGEKTAQQMWEYLQQSDIDDEYPPKVSS